MTTMRAQSPADAKRPYWYKLTGPNAGIQRYVKNLGWIRRLSSSVTAIDVAPGDKGGAHLQATLADGRRFYSPFASYDIACAFALRDQFAHATITGVKGAL